MNSYSKLRRTIIKEGNVYSAKSLFSGLIKEEVGKIDIDNPEFYDIETKTLKFPDKIILLSTILIVNGMALIVLVIP